MNQKFSGRDLKPGTKILFANVPADGHFNPLTGLAAHLKEAGCDVRWYTSVTYREKIQRMGIPFYPLKRAIDISANTDIDKVFPERKNHKGMVSKLKFDMINAFILRSPEYFHDMEEIRNEFAFEVMICDNTFGAIPFVKERMNIPVLAIGVVPLTETSKELAPPGMGLTPSTSFWGKRKQSLLRYVANKFLFAKPNQVMHDLLKQYGIDAGKASIFDLLIRKSSFLLQSGTPGFEYARTDLGNNIRFLGPLLPHSSKKTNLKPWHHEKLRRYEKLILVTQGTVERDNSKLIVPMLEAFRDTEYLIVVTTGGSETQKLRETYEHDNIIIEDFIPFDEVMPHADLYVSNGGYGGVLLAVQHGLPMVVAGVHEGKNEINARVGYFNLGINMKTEKPVPAKLKEAVEKVLWNESYAANVRKLNREFREYDPGALCADYVAEVLGARPTVKKRVEELEVIY
jgi:MGT family glycosyltransferase